MGLADKDVKNILDLYEWDTGFFCVEVEQKKPTNLWNILNPALAGNMINVTNPTISAGKINENNITFKVNVGIQVVRPANYIDLNITT